ncbi:MAG: ribosome biogenesis GTPase YlqF [Bacilli bacterium]|jgi:ribosome biogenesis GTPase A|nr:ribosome biogenesis GTPase YlqF [Bacilli bacterium]NLN79871.1 ribosome biogenesis GTPase YlqF [Erysipelotrichia bacterium]
MSNIHWYPGHMKRAMRELLAKLKLVDFVIELRDARALISSANDDFLKVHALQIKRIVVITKADLANEDETKKWEEYYKQERENYLILNLLKEHDIQKLIKEINKLHYNKVKSDVKKGMLPQPIRLMIIGMPNVGKSTLINKLSKKKSAQTEKRPGKTKAQQWIKVNQQFELLDTPGILPTKYDMKQQAINLALLGMIKEQILPKENLALEIIAYFRENEATRFLQFYKVGETIFEKTNEEILHHLASLGSLQKGGLINLDRLSTQLLSHFRQGKFGPVTLEKVSL